MSRGGPGNGYAFGGKKAQAMRERLDRLKRDPDAARRLFGLKPQEPQSDA